MSIHELTSSCCIHYSIQVRFRPSAGYTLEGDTMPLKPIIKVCRLALTALRQNPVSAVVKHRIAPFRCADECQRCYQKKYKVED
jgi:hypothetical protein